MEITRRAMFGRLATWTAGLIGLRSSEAKAAQKLEHDIRTKRFAMVVGASIFELREGERLLTDATIGVELVGPNDDDRCHAVSHDLLVGNLDEQLATFKQRLTDAVSVYMSHDCVITNSDKSAAVCDKLPIGVSLPKATEIDRRRILRSVVYAYQTADGQGGHRPIPDEQAIVRLILELHAWLLARQKPAPFKSFSLSAEELATYKQHLAHMATEIPVGEK